MLGHVVVLALGALCVVVACGPAPGVHTGDRCEPSDYPSRCVDGVLLLECAPATDCTHHDCSGFGCTCYEYPHIRRTDCEERDQRCVVDGNVAGCKP